MKLLIAACSLCLAVSSSAFAASATTQPAQPANTKCPVTGEDIDTRITTQYDGKTIAFCCKDCIATFKKDPAKYMKGLK